MLLISVLNETHIHTFTDYQGHNPKIHIGGDTIPSILMLPKNWGMREIHTCHEDAAYEFLV